MPQSPSVQQAESRTHAAPQRFQPALQVKPQLVPSHVAVELAGFAQGAHCTPQLAGLVLAPQLEPHTW